MKPINFEVVEKNGESQERLIKRFIKKTSRNRVVQNYIDKMYFESKSQKQRTKKAKKKYIKKKIQDNYEKSINSEKSFK